MSNTPEKRFLVCEGDAMKGEIVFAVSVEDAAKYYFAHNDPLLSELSVYEMEQEPSHFERNVKVKRVKR